MTNSHRFCSSKNQRRENLQISSLSLSLRDGTALCIPKPPWGIFACERDTSCSRICLPTFWHHLAFFCHFQPDYLSFPNCTKAHCHSSKGEPLDGGCLCYQNICPMQQQLNTTFQEAVLNVLFSLARRSWGESRQTLWMHNCDCLSDTWKCNSLTSNEGFLWLHMSCVSLNKPTSRLATLAF